MHSNFYTHHELSMVKLQDDHGNVLHHGNMERAVKVLERMENQNTFKELAMDFKVSCKLCKSSDPQTERVCCWWHHKKGDMSVVCCLKTLVHALQYWDDMSDQYRQAEGSLLPLWKFYTERCKHKHVTSLCWNPEYYDLFAVGYGSFDFLHQSSGLVCCYSLKNPSYPEYVFGTDSGDFYSLTLPLRWLHALASAVCWMTATCRCNFSVVTSPELSGTDLCVKAISGSAYAEGTSILQTYTDRHDFEQHFSLSGS